MSSSNSTQTQVPSQVPVPATIMMETRKSLEDFRLPQQRNQWNEFKLEFLAGLLFRLILPVSLLTYLLTYL